MYDYLEYFDVESKLRGNTFHASGLTFCELFYCGFLLVIWIWNTNVYYAACFKDWHA